MCGGGQGVGPDGWSRAAAPEPIQPGDRCGASAQTAAERYTASMTDERSTAQIEGEIAALRELKDELAQKVRNEDVANPRMDVIHGLLTEYSRCDRELVRLKKVLKKGEG